MNVGSAAVSEPAEAACSLAPNELTERVGAWRELAARARDRTVEPGRITSTYPQGPETVERLTELIEAERTCCAFLRFTVREEADLVHVELEYPPEFGPLLARVFDAP